MGAEGIVDLVYGMINPSGKLAVSIPWCVGQVPISYWDIKTGHVLTEDNLENRFTSRYMDIPNSPLYPFGFGLSYTEFDISDVEVKIGQDKRVHVHCNVSNTGKVAGAEVVQCYYETLQTSVVRPKKELVRFQKVFWIREKLRVWISLLIQKSFLTMIKIWKSLVAECNFESV